jgi:hypothetical protein
MISSGESGSKRGEGKDKERSVEEMIHDVTVDGRCQKVAELTGGRLL